MREILFRGQAANRIEGRAYRTNYKNGDWVYGLLTDAENYAGFSEMTNTTGVSGIEVDKNTVGQFTGLTDKNGKKIFEGDILTPLDDEIDFIVEFNNGCFNGVSYAIKGAMMEYGWDECAGGYGVVECEPLDSYHPEKYHEVIGNIHDNPELLEVSK